MRRFIEIGISEIGIGYPRDAAQLPRSARRGGIDPAPWPASFSCSTHAHQPAK
jgi:hypothetical protein